MNHRKTFAIAAITMALFTAWSADTLQEIVTVAYNFGFQTYNNTYNITSAVTTTNGASQTLTITNGGLTTVTFNSTISPGTIIGINVSPTSTVGFVKFSVDGTNFIGKANPGKPFLFDLATNQVTFSVSSNAPHTVFFKLFGS